MTAVIELRGVGRTYPGTPPVVALTQGELQVRRGEYVAVTGRSGSGKTTLLNILGLLDEPTEGHYLIDGVSARGLSEATRCAIRSRKVGFVFQEFHLLAYRTAVENVELALLYAGIARGGRAAKARHALDQVGLGHRHEALPTTLSGGERQRVAIARAVVTDPSILLCDEPTGNLDSHTASTVLEVISDMHRHGQTVIVATHDSTVAERAGRIVEVRDGLLYAGTL